MFKFFDQKETFDFDSKMISKKTSTIAYISIAIGIFDFSLAEPGRAGQNKLQFQYQGKYVDLY